MWISGCHKNFVFTFELFDDLFCFFPTRIRYDEVEHVYLVFNHVEDCFRVVFAHLCDCFHVYNIHQIAYLYAQVVVSGTLGLLEPVQNLYLTAYGVV